MLVKEAPAGWPFFLSRHLYMQGRAYLHNAYVQKLTSIDVQNSPGSAFVDYALYVCDKKSFKIFFIMLFM